MNAFDIILLVFVGLSVTGAVLSLIRNRKKGGCIGCSGRCAGCIGCK